MPKSITDRNLLVGILALQMDFIDREQLVAAMNAWVLDKSRALEEVLVDQGAIRADTQGLVVAVVDKHLELHESDPQSSIAAASSVASVREQLLCIADSELQESLGHVSAARRDVTFATEPHSAGAADLKRERFTILRPHARGGLGQVSVAQDHELNREVALKEIQLRYADDPNVRGRFVTEAEVTGGLEHPGIVPVYALGQYDDGRPFYAMRFIRGESLKEAIDRHHANEQEESGHNGRSLELRKLLSRFIDICNAIGYAHDRGVLHRDLKPSNVMLGKHGDTLVVDWGLAKTTGSGEKHTGDQEPLWEPSSGSGSARTQMGSAVGTPAFMSPEQAAGRLDEVGPASDLYSLGATLYCLLAGKPPMSKGDTGQVLKRVQRGDFPPPRSVLPKIAKPLEAICLKAMSLQAEDRYSSAGGLADDLERWLADEPVSAYSESSLEKASRWMRHHRSWSLACATSLIALAVISTISFLFVNQARKEEAAQRQIAEEEAEFRFELFQKTGLAMNRLRTMSFVAYSRACSAAARIATTDDSMATGQEVPSERIKTRFRTENELLQSAGEESVKKAFNAFLEGLDRSASNEELRRLSLELADACGAEWRQEANGQPKLQQEVRQRIYQKARTAANRLAGAERLMDVADAYDTFWELYWGELNIVAGQEVHEAKTTLGETLTKWKKQGGGVPSPELRDALQRETEKFHAACLPSQE